VRYGIFTMMFRPPTYSSAFLQFNLLYAAQSSLLFFAWLSPLLSSHFFVPSFYISFCLFSFILPFYLSSRLHFSPSLPLLISKSPSLPLSLLPVHSKLSVDVTGGRIPLFSVDLKVAEATVDSPAKFVYSSPADSIFTSVMSHFDKTFEVLKGNCRK
jgi:hypothetical protein